MTRTAVGYVAMVAAAVSVGALGYAVLWAYVEPEAPAVAMSTQAAPPVSAPPTKETEKPAPASPPAQAAEVAPDPRALTPLESPAATIAQPSVRNEPAPIKQERVDVAPSPPSTPAPSEIAPQIDNKSAQSAPTPPQRTAEAMQ